MMTPRNFDVVEMSKKNDGMGGVETKETTISTIFGWIDLNVGSDDRSSQNASTEESTHVLITDAIYEVNDDQYIFDGVKLYQITYVDNPVGLDDHLEIYLKVS